MLVDNQVRHALKDADAEVNVVITCSGNLSNVEQTLVQQGVKIISSIPEFLIFNAQLNQQQLVALQQQKGIDSIELDEEQTI